MAAVAAADAGDADLVVLNANVYTIDPRLPKAEAFRVNTINGAYASKEENLRGTITPGKLADFVMLAEDPHTIDQEKIKDIAIVRTVVGGTTVYEA